MVNVTFLPIYNDKSQLLGGCLVIMYQHCSLRKVFDLFCWSVVVTNNKIHKREDRGRWGAEVIVCNISWLFGAHFQNMTLEDNFPATSFNASLNTDILGSENTNDPLRSYTGCFDVNDSCCHHYDHYHHHLCCCCHCHHHW